MDGSLSRRLNTIFFQDVSGPTTIQLPATTTDKTVMSIVAKEYCMGIPDTEEYSYIGCFKDDRHRDLDVFVGNGYKAETCSRACEGYLYFALQYHGECFCDNHYSSEAKYEKVDDSQCGSDKKGTAWKNAVYAQTKAVCASDVRECSDGSYVSRDPVNDCKFPECPTSDEKCGANPVLFVSGVETGSKLQLAAGKEIWHDRNYAFDTIPTDLTGGFYQQLPHKAIARGTVISISISKPAVVYVIFENSHRSGGFQNSLPEDGWSPMDGSLSRRLNTIFFQDVSVPTTIQLPATTTDKTVMSIVAKEYCMDIPDTEETYTSRIGTMCRGNNPYWEHQGVIKTEDCQALCTASDECNAFDMSPNTGTGDCYLHFTEVPEFASTSSTVTCYIKNIKSDYVVVLGDSIAERSKSKLSDYCSGKALLNKAVEGSTSADWVLDSISVPHPHTEVPTNMSPTDILNSIDTTKYRVTHVWISLGANDYFKGCQVPENLASNLQSIFNKIRSLKPNAKIIATGYAQLMRETPPSVNCPQDNRKLINELNTELKTICESNGVMFVDNTWIFGGSRTEYGDEKYYHDWLHYNELGYCHWFTDNAMQSALECSTSPGEC